jgi:hypothetical protein
MSEEFIDTIVDGTTGEITKKPMSAEAIKDLKETQARWAVIREKEESVQAARLSALAKLAALGLTEEEVNGLIS